MTVWIELGVVARPHGVSGEVRVHAFNPDSTLLVDANELYMRAAENDEPQLVDVISVRPGPKALLMRIAGVGSREEADALRGRTFCVPRTALPELDEGEYYHSDLVGLEAFENGELIGKVVEVMDYPSVECLKIERPNGFLEVPMLPQWLDRVDVKAGEVHLKSLEDIPLQRR